MKLKVFTLQMDEETGRFDDAPLQSFMEDERQRREVIDVSDHFFVHEKRPTWALLVSYREINADGRGPKMATMVISPLQGFPCLVITPGALPLAFLSRPCRGLLERSGYPLFDDSLTFSSTWPCRAFPSAAGG